MSNRVTTKRAQPTSKADEEILDGLRFEALAWIQAFRNCLPQIPKARRAQYFADAQKLRAQLEGAVHEKSVAGRASIYTRVAMIAIAEMNEVARSFKQSSHAKKPRTRRSPKEDAVLALLNADPPVNRTDLLAKKAKCSLQLANRVKNEWLAEKLKP